jgi:hypothetical protein
MAVTLTPPRNQVLLHGVSWAIYQGLIHDLEAAPGQRLTYDQMKLI